MSTRYVWEKWNRNSRQTYRLSWFSGNDSFTVGEPRRCYESYTFDKYTGIVTGVTPCYPYGEEYEGRTVYGLGSVSYLDIDWASSVCSRWGWNPHDARAATVEEDEPEYSKGTTSYGNVTSSNSGAYPNNNYSGSYWYVLKGTDSIDPTAVTYPSPLFKGQNVRVTVTPVSPTYGGTIKYKYEYTTNGSSWTVANSGTTATSLNISIPVDATTFQARVTASDDTGFTSTTAITGTSLPVYNIDPTAVTYNEDDLSVGNDITVSITAANSGYTGTVTYIIQTNVNGTGWEYETESTSTNVPLTIPSDAVSWAVRVQAKAEDYTSSTYVYGNGHTEGVAVKQTAGFNIVPENKHLGYLGSETR